MQTFAIIFIYLAAVPMFFGTLNLCEDTKFKYITSKQLPITLIFIGIGMIILGNILYLLS